MRTGAAARLAGDIVAEQRADRHVMRARSGQSAKATAVIRP